MKIFIQIASYRDPQLIPTIKNCLENAKYPNNLVFGIARQFNETDKFDDLSEYYSDKRFKILNIPYNESKGACWARHLIQQLYEGEDYTLQIDSHMRFVKDWDVILINMIEALIKKGFNKPIITTYAPSFNPETEQKVIEAWRMNFDKYTPEGVVFFLPEKIPNWNELTEPIRARFYSAHFCFTIGQFALEVQHDPEMYFHGEEISIAVRAYTHGYDLFHPHIPIIWHEYTRKGRVKHWDDNKSWTSDNEKSLKRNRILLGIDNDIKIDFDRVGLGKLRTLRDYEIYSGLLFSKRAVQQYTLDKEYPPNPYNFNSEEDWFNSFASNFKYDIRIHKDNFIENDYDFFVVAFHDNENNTLYRKDADKDEIIRIFRTTDSSITITREFSNEKIPSYWVVWPHSKTKGWSTRLVGNI